MLSQQNLQLAFCLRVTVQLPEICRQIPPRGHVLRRESDSFLEDASGLLQFLVDRKEGSQGSEELWVVGIELYGRAQFGLRLRQISSAARFNAALCVRLSLAALLTREHGCGK